MGRSRFVAAIRPWWWVVAGLACCLPLVWLSFHRSTNKSLRPPVEDSPDFQAALRLIDQGQQEHALRLLRRIAEEHTRSALLLFYIGTTLNEQQEEPAEAERRLNAALALPDAEKSLIAWGKVHPEIVPALENFAKERLGIGRDNTKEDVEALSDEHNDAGRANLEQRYKLCRKALHIAEDIGPDSQMTQYLLAKIDEFSGDLVSADQRLSRSIDLAKYTNGAETEMAYLCHMARCRNVISLADRLRGQGSSRPALERALKLTRQAESDLRRCMGYFDATVSPNHRIEGRELRGLKLRVLLTLIETEVGLGLLSEARAQISRARKAMSDLTDYARSMGLTPPAMGRFTERLDAVESRLSVAQ